ncbi:hypothetical protein L1267_12200 [Pseudoalteromonas sp. OFAV1]|uniref:hypothetical protein n=1 Tax=Pseudoalteromonas sp. OFAV1 TaxID=2908892 RepID=UPI001F2955AD|nr:hypothetical protein [Pseudoalteromonas sp. OFAV1]MCF2901153.1 hypothetical protein [Pseudoalteromonas sp. OFAV1]
MNIADKLRTKLEDVLGAQNPTFQVLSVLLDTTTPEQIDVIEKRCVELNCMPNKEIKGISVFRVRSHQHNRGHFLVATKTQKEAAELIGCSVYHLSQYGLKSSVDELHTIQQIQAYNAPNTVISVDD